MNVKTDHTGMADARPATENGLVPVHVAIKRNEGMTLEPSLFEAIDVNLSAAERRAATLTTRRSVKKAWQAAWLVRAIECIDLTTLAGDDTPGNVQRLCAKGSCSHCSFLGPSAYSAPGICVATLLMDWHC